MFYHVNILHFSLVQQFRLLKITRKSSIDSASAYTYSTVDFLEDVVVDVVDVLRLAKDVAIVVPT